MKRSYYFRLARTGIKKNRRLYRPYMFASAAMVAIHYIIAALSVCPGLEYVIAGGSLGFILSLGKFVVAAFSLMFLFYTNSFLVKSRRKEFGLYSVLGMGKRHISRIVLWEAFISSAISLVFGLCAGIVLYRLAELGIFNMVQMDISYSFNLPLSAVLYTVILYGAIFVLVTIKNIIHIRRHDPLELLNSEKTGEKPPKANWVIGIAGIIGLCMAYYIAVTIKEPVDAIIWFFIAVLLVIVSTYLIFIASSVVMCRLLQKNKKYYYKANHFTTVSSMAYRMKRNGAGLASICILSTMVLVMITSSSSLYFGKEGIIKERYPREICCETRLRDMEQYSDENKEKLKSMIRKLASSYGGKTENEISVSFGSVAGMLSDDKLLCDVEDARIVSFEQVRQVYLLSYAEYSYLSGAPSPDGTMLLTSGCGYGYDTLSLDSYTVKLSEVKESDIDLNFDFMQTIPTFFLVLPDIGEAIEQYRQSDGSYKYVDLKWLYDFDTGADKTVQRQIGSAEMPWDTGAGFDMFFKSSRPQEEKDFIETFGGLFFLGIILSAAFLFAAVLIIYYKQISEGYEDMARFEIMRKVGMTKHDIRRSVNSQMLTVFLMPLLFAGLHLAFAFPIVDKLLRLFGLFDRNLFLVTTLVCFLIFAVFYSVVYKLTSKAYYSLAAGIEE